MATNLCAAAFGLLGFSLSLIIGLWAQNPFVTVILRALAGLVVFYILGTVLSVVGQKVILENFHAATDVPTPEPSDQHNDAPGDSQVAPAAPAAQAAPVPGPAPPS